MNESVSQKDVKVNIIYSTNKSYAMDKLMKPDLI